MKPDDVKGNTYIEQTELHSNKNINDKDPKFKVGDHERISKYKNIFAKGYTTTWSEEIFIMKKVKKTVPWTYVINDLKVKKLSDHFMEKNYKRLINMNLGSKKQSRKKVINYMSNGKVMIVHLIAGLIKKN